MYLILWRLSVTLTLGVIGALSHLIEPGDKSCDSRLVYEVLCVCLSLIQLTNINWMTWGGKEQSPRFLGFIAPEERGIQTNGFSAQCQVAIKALKYNQWYQGTALASRVPLCSQERESRAWWHYNPHTQETDTVRMVSLKSAWSMQWVLGQLLGNARWKLREAYECI